MALNDRIVRNEKMLEKDGYTRKNEETYINLLRQAKREGVDKLISWLLSTDFFEAPSSSRPKYHGCEKGGLAKHSLNVYTLFEEKSRRFQMGLKLDEIIIASLCHDFCKIDFYKPNPNPDSTEREKKPYIVEAKPPFGHGEKSLYLTTKHIGLNEKESLLIRWHMSAYDKEWLSNEEKVLALCPEITAFQTADQEASDYLDLNAKGNDTKVKK